MYKLTFQTGPLKGRKLTVKKGSVVIGSGSNCHIQIQDTELDPRHCVIEWRSDGTFLRSLSPSARTLVNDAPQQEVRLVFGDRIQLGKTVILYQPSETRVAEHARRISSIQTLTFVSIGLVILFEIVFLAALSIWRVDKDNATRPLPTPAPDPKMAEKLSFFEEQLARIDGTSPDAAAENKIAPESTPIPIFTPTPVPENTPVSTPLPEPTATPLPEATSIPEPTPAAGPEPQSTASPEPTVPPAIHPTQTPKPITTPRPTATPEPTAAPLPSPTVAATPIPAEPSPTPVPAVPPAAERQAEIDKLIIRFGLQENAVSTIARDMMQEGMGLLEKGDIPAAEMKFEQAKIVDPAYFPAYILQAEQLEAAGKIKEARKEWKALIKASRGTFWQEFAQQQLDDFDKRN